MGDPEEAIGLTTRQALDRLCKEIEQTVEHHDHSHRHKRLKSWLFYSLHHSSHHTSINWISTTLLLLSSLALLAAYSISAESPALVYECVLIFLLASLSVAVELHDNRLRQGEMSTRVRALVDDIRRQTERIDWSPQHYPHLCTPYSPCITLQWTYRDGRVVNLPWALLVKDDVVIIRPGQSSPGYCEALDKSSEFPLLHSKEVYGPSLQTANEIFSVPKARRPLENRRYRLLETPYLDSLKVALEQALERPDTPHNKQRHLVMVRVVQRIVLPLVVALVLCINFVRFTYLDASTSRTSATDLFLVVPVSTVLPLLPIMFPIVWVVLNYVGIARFKSLYDVSLGSRKDYDMDDTDANNKSETTLSSSVQPDVHALWTNFREILFGQAPVLPRTANILQVLGSVTALCCVDKKGVLSWPNPTAEKVFFLHNNDNVSEASSLANVNDLNQDGIGGGGNGTKTPSNTAGKTSPSNPYHSDESSTAVAEVLDVTYNPNDPFQLHFDDTKWHKHLNSLKPLGLAILLNTCNVETQEHYTQFCSHITCEAMYNENLVPVTNRRCLCELAKEIGFLEQAQKVFSLEQQLSTFRHLQPEMVRRDNKYARSLSMSTKLKFPFPHMFAVVVKELSSGSIQLLSQGTADIVLDSCVDYWDGFDLCPLTPADRKKIQDFYQRSSLTAYCTAFAYRPLSKVVNNKLSRVYLELPSDSRHLYQCHRSPTPVHWECRSVLEPKIRTPLGPFYSTDSLLYNDSPCPEVADADSCFDMQCNQVLIGMVTMQYQAQSDMVHLIEQLERACIRFVHFSKENELRSRVFSEKMGLESGWNCHISLLSDRNRQENVLGPSAAAALSRRNLRRKSQSDRRLCTFDTPEFQTVLDSNLESSRTMSFSAPSAINMEHTVVKFDTDNVPTLTRQVSNDAGGPNEAAIDRVLSQESVQIHAVDLNREQPHDWQSLSCLTDSTEQSAPINFDMSNRAKLPRGIDKIRPHIELIDNVPLLVSLFTDCTASNTKEMLHIMQDYGEIVCVMGSSANNDNMGIFMQADASIAMEPIYPQVCQKRNTYEELPPDADYMSPIDMSRSLNSIACSLSFKREESISIYHLVMEARHYMSSLWNIAQFWLSCCISMTIVQLAAAVFMLPSILTPGQVMWINCILVPTLSISLIGNKTDRDIMKKPQGKNQIVFNAEVAYFVLWCYGTKFLPVILIVLITFASSLASFCTETCDGRNCSCALFYLPVEDRNATASSNGGGGWIDAEYAHALQYSQNLIVIVILLLFMTVSAGFVHRECNVWTKSPHTNGFWVVTVIILTVLQSIYSLINMTEAAGHYADNTSFHFRAATLSFAFISPAFTLIINEVVKREEIKKNLRQQRRARLDFGTKLGMNSPF